MPPYLELLFIPFTAGIVGYVTNALAIRMLFRPFKPHWYTLGWQGIIPRTRIVLAKSVAKIVGERLVTAEEISKTLASPELAKTISSVVQNRLSAVQSAADRQAVHEKIASFMNDIAGPLAHAALYDPRISAAIDRGASAAVSSILHYFGNTPAKDLETYFYPAVAAANHPAAKNSISRGIEKLIQDAISRTVNSGQTLRQLLSGSVRFNEIADDILTLITPMIETLLTNPEVADALSDVLIQYKAEQFGGKMYDRVKLGAVNLFFYDDKIRSLVHEKLPDLGKRISRDVAIQKHIRKTIERKIAEIADRPLNLLVKNIGTQKYDAFIRTVPAFITAELLPDKLGNYLLSLLHNANPSGGATLNDLLDKAGTSFKALIPAQLPLSVLLRKNNTEEFLKNAVSFLFSAANTFSSGTIEWISSQFTQKILAVLHGLTPSFLKWFNLTSMVEEKINSLDAAEVEDMLFSFMKDHFKWINILGFIIGFLVGVGQMAFLIIKGHPVP